MIGHINFWLYRIFIKLILLVFLFSTTGCATQWVNLNAEDRRLSVIGTYTDVKYGYALNDIIVLKMEKEINIDEYQSEYGGEKTLCFHQGMDFSNAVGVEYISYGKEKKFLCESVGDDFLVKEYRLNMVKDYSGSLLIPELNISIGGINDIRTSTSVCDCSNLSDINSRAVKAYAIDRYSFFLEMDDGTWLKFYKERMNNILDYYRFTISSVEEFNSESNVRELEIKTMDDDGYLIVRLANRKEIIFQSPYLDSLKYKRIIIRESLEDVKEIEGNKAYYALLPITIVFDIVTLPIQMIAFVYALGSNSTGAN